MGPVPRVLHPATNPAGYTATAGTVYAGVVMVWNSADHHGSFSAPVFVALLAAVASLFTRFLVTPVADPKNCAGVPLVSAPPVVPPSGAVRIVPQPDGPPPGKPPGC